MRIKKILQKCLSLTLSLAVMFSLSTPIFSVGANGDSTGSQNVGLDTSTAGFTAELDQGLRISIVSASDGSLYNDSVVDLVPNGFYHESEGHDYTSVGTDKNSSGTTIDNKTLDKNIPLPVSDTGSSLVGNGNATKEWMLQKNKDGEQNIVALIKEQFGPEVAAKVASGELKISMEGLYNIPMYDGYNDDGVSTYQGYRATGTIRDIIMNELQANGLGCCGWQSPTIKR